MAFPTAPGTDIPLWAYASGASLVEPPASQMSSGWTAVPGQNYGQIPPYQWENWLKFSAGQWLQYSKNALAYLSVNGITGMKVRTFTYIGSVQDYVPTAGMVVCIFEAIGAGGGSGYGSPNTFTVGGGSGGGAGEYVRLVATAATVGAGLLLTIGQGGILSAGGNTIVGSLITAHGGGSGVAFNGGVGSNFQVVGGDGGTGNITGDLVIPGGRGNPAYYNATANLLISGNGANSFFGAGGIAGIIASATSSVVSGQNGQAYGAGGGGAAYYLNAGSNNPGNGQNGVVVITEFLSG